MNRTKLENRTLPGYSKGEETFNMVSHIVGGGVGVVALLACTIVAAYHQNSWGIASGAIYGFTVILLFTMSSIYHGLKPGIPKKVFQVLDHCTIFLLIAGTYTPILLGRFREVYPAEAWIIFMVIWGLAALGIVLNAIDLKRYKIFSMAAYLGMGWTVILCAPKVIAVLSNTFFMFMLLGGVFYTLGALCYGIGKKMKIKYIHSIFHIFVDAAAIMHFVGIVVFVMPAR